MLTNYCYSGIGFVNRHYDKVARKASERFFEYTIFECCKGWSDIYVLWVKVLILSSNNLVIVLFYSTNSSMYVLFSLDQLSRYLSFPDRRLFLASWKFIDLDCLHFRPLQCLCSLLWTWSLPVYSEFLQLHGKIRIQTKSSLLTSGVGSLTLK